MSEILLSQLAHVELISPKPEETAKWMVDVLGLEETTREGQSVYLRSWAEWLHSSLIVTEGPGPAVEHIGWRAYGPGDPDLMAKRVEALGIAGEWVDSSVGHGAAFRYRSPIGGHQHEVFWETELYKAPADKAEPDFLNRPQRYVSRGAAARYLDHVTVATKSINDDLAFYKSLGHRHTAQISPEPGFNAFSTMTCNAIRSTHDFALVPDAPSGLARANHIAYRVDQRSDVERAWEALHAHGTAIEFGPGVHGLDEITYLYVREPGGFRIEINSGGWINTMPDWQATDWNATQGGTTMTKNVQMPTSMMESWPALEEQGHSESRDVLDSTTFFVES